MGAANGPVSGRRVVFQVDEGVEPLLIRAVLDSVGQFPDDGEPDCLDRADGGLVRLRDAGDHNGAAAQPGAHRCGGSGRSPLPSFAPLAARVNGN